MYLNIYVFIYLYIFIYLFIAREIKSRVAMGRAEFKKGQFIEGWTVLFRFLCQTNVCLHIQNDTTQRVLYSQYSLQHVSAA
jgi:hypothetical protein